MARPRSSAAHASDARPGSGTRHDLELGPFQYRFVRAVMHLGDRAFGNAIQAHLEKELETRINTGQLYLTAARLVDHGFLKAEEGHRQTNGRAATLYVCLPKGAEAVAQAREQFRRLAE